MGVHLLAGEIFFSSLHYSDQFWGPSGLPSNRYQGAFCQEQTERITG